MNEPNWTPPDPDTYRWGRADRFCNRALLVCLIILSLQIVPALLRHWCTIP